MLLAISNSAEAYPKKPEEEHPKKLEEEHPQEKQICFEGKIFKGMISENFFEPVQELEKYFEWITYKDEDVEDRENMLSLSVYGNSSVFPPEIPKEMALENSWVKQLEARGVSPSDWKIILNPSVKFKNLRTIYLSGENIVQPLEHLARWWDNPDKKELVVYGLKNCSLRPLDKMRNIHVILNYHMGEYISIDEMNYLFRLIKAPKEPNALRRSAKVEVNVVNSVMVAQSYRLFEQDPCRNFFFRPTGKNVYELRHQINRTEERSAFWKIAEALKGKNKNRMEEE